MRLVERKSDLSEGRGITILKRYHCANRQRWWHNHRILALKKVDKNNTRVWLRLDSSTFCYEFTLALYVKRKKKKRPPLNSCRSPDFATLPSLYNKLRLLMGYCCRPAPTYDGFSRLLLILAVILILLVIPKLLPVIELPAREPINWGLVAVPLLLLAVVHWLSSMAYPCKYYAVPPCKCCHYYWCKGCLPWGVPCWLCLAAYGGREMPVSLHLPEGWFINSVFPHWNVMCVQSSESIFLLSFFPSFFLFCFFSVFQGAESCLS